MSIYFTQAAADRIARKLRCDFVFRAKSEHFLYAFGPHAIRCKAARTGELLDLEGVARRPGHTSPDDPDNWMVFQAFVSVGRPPLISAFQLLLAHALCRTVGEHRLSVHPRLDRSGGVARAWANYYHHPTNSRSFGHSQVVEPAHLDMLLSFFRDEADTGVILDWFTDNYGWEVPRG